MAEDYRGGFAICPTCGGAVADDRLELHDAWHNDQPTLHDLNLLGAVVKVSQQNPLRVREWPDAAPEAPTLPPEAAAGAMQPESVLEPEPDSPFSRY